MIISVLHVCPVLGAAALHRVPGVGPPPPHTLRGSPHSHQSHWERLQCRQRRLGAIHHGLLPLHPVSGGGNIQRKDKI